MAKSKITPVIKNVPWWVRYCGGSPTANVPYLHIPGSNDHMGLDGVEIGNFLCDPVYPLPEDFGLSPIGMQVRQRYDQFGQPEIGANGQPIYDVYDWIGSHHYRNEMDWVREIMYCGFHQLMSTNFPYKLLSQESVYYGVHSRAYVIDNTAYYEKWRDNSVVDWKNCPCDIPSHQDGVIDSNETCPGLFAQDLITWSADLGDSIVRVDMPCGQSYKGYKEVEGVIHMPGVFIKLPIGYMADFLIYEDPDNDKIQTALDALEGLAAELQNVVIVPWTNESTIQGVTL